MGRDDNTGKREGCEMNFDCELLPGGVIHVSPDAIGWNFRSLCLTVWRRWNHIRMVDRAVQEVLASHRAYSGWTIGDWKHGRYVLNSGRLSKMKSFTVEIRGVTRDLLVGVADRLRIVFGQESVMVVCDGRVLIIGETGA